MDNNKIKNWLYKLGKISFNLQFSTSKLLGYIIIGLGFYLSNSIKSESVWMWSVLAATALFGVKVWSSNINNKKEQE